ncbi:MAG: xanthine dehydrogenase family protein, partial [Pirellulaceae bacterium]|nr:xanthine dehydrogenase family protein [Pirellulaceae bacterium]
MVEYSWPAKADAKVVGKSHERLDGVAKTTGTAKFSYDQYPKNVLIARALGCPHAHCKIKSISVRDAKAVDGVVHVETLTDVGKEIQWQGELLVIVAAESEGAAAEGVDAIKIEYEKLDVFTSDEDLTAAEKAGRAKKGGSKVVTEREPGDDDDEDEFVEAEIERLFKSSEFIVEGYYGVDAITHCCLEPHGSTVEWKDGKLVAHLSTQNVSGTDDGFARDLKVTADDVTVICDYIGGGFGSKFAPDYWGVAAARISKATGRPVQLMLTRDQELKIAGNRPSGYLKVKLGADKDGVVQVWDSHHWGTSGNTGGGVSQGVIPYVLVPRNYRRKQTQIATNTVRARAWRAPNHPQACAITQTALDDLARVMGKDSYDVFAANLPNASNKMSDVYAAEMEIGAKLMGWKDKYHLHGKGAAKGDIVEGLGMGLHMWGGVANTSNCQLKVRPDGSVESFCGTQDIGSGTRTICAQVLAETFGLGLDDVTVNIGSSKYPMSGASGGSTTVGAVCESHRRASQDALEQLNKLVAAKLGVQGSTLVASSGRIHVAGDRNRGLSWKDAC